MALIENYYKCIYVQQFWENTVYIKNVLVYSTETTGLHVNNIKHITPTMFNTLEWREFCNLVEFNNVLALGGIMI
jgi:hypothetical protein